MKHSLVLLAVLPLMLSVARASRAQNAPAGGQSQTIVRAGSQPVTKGPAEYFTGNVTIAPLFESNAAAPYVGAYVTFEPGARSAWHTHPTGQRLIVTEGVGRTGVWGGPVREIKAGDVVWCPPNVKHWHGAAPNSAMTHLALTGSVNGRNVNWLEKVTEAQYNMVQTTPTETGRPTIAQPNVEARRLSPDDVLSVAPALERYTQERLYGEVWNRPGLSKRDRSLVSVATLIARGQSGALTYYFGQALDNGVQPREISETITHLAYYTGWGNAFAAVGPAQEVFTRRGIGPDQLPSASPALLPLDAAAEAQRAAGVSTQFGQVASGVVQYTTDYLFRDLWLRPDLTPRDRSLITVAALIASGQSEQVSYHLNRMMDNGLTQEQASEMLTHLAFYAGWPRVFSVLPLVKEVFEKRPR
jgi:4-carboxymuconolactone decarboxylase